MAAKRNKQLPTLMCDDKGNRVTKSRGRFYLLGVKYTEADIRKMLNQNLLTPFKREKKVKLVVKSTPPVKSETEEESDDEVF